MLSTVVTFIGGVVEQVAPVFNKFIGKSTTLPPTTINPNCQPPLCGTKPYYCPNDELSPICLQQRYAFERNVPRHLTTFSSDIMNDDNENLKKCSTSMSPNTTIMLVFIGVIALAIIAFLYVRCNHRNAYKRDYDDRKSSTWDV
ncbi:unnamed protein product [Adineta steineri]|uniref:Uncharacterized protein n=1 Tax=Adineta steineri TaxID=433720 RepID=A0A813WJZ1_9BILA|nr:unnamed protein product [Adineta steineri]CAF1373902.1 unnamed protein product [Adineta steineri]